MASMATDGEILSASRGYSLNFTSRLVSKLEAHLARFGSREWFPSETPISKASFANLKLGEGLKFQALNLIL